VEPAQAVRKIATCGALLASDSEEVHAVRQHFAFRELEKKATA
jgi:hypothetical protein